MRQLLTLICTICAAGAYCVPAEAHSVHHLTSNPTALALVAAEHYWGSTPCGGAITITDTHAPSLDNLPSMEGNDAGGTVAAWTVWSGESPSAYTNCVITFNASMWRNWKADDENYQEYCDIMTHEVGHLFGHDDDATTNPESIEYPIIGWENYNSVPECRGVTLYYGYETFRDESESETQCELRRQAQAELAGKETWTSCPTG